MSCLRASTSLRAFWLSTVLVLDLVPTPSPAQDTKFGAIRLTEATLPQPFRLNQLSHGATTNSLDRELEASAVGVLADGRHLLVAHDKESALRLVDRASGVVLSSDLVAPGFPTERLDGGKWEGLAQDASGRIYVIGAHSGKTAEERLDRGYLLRFALAPEPTPRIDPDSVEAWRLGDALLEFLTREGLAQDRLDVRKIEGLAIREGLTDRDEPQVVIGLREPDDRVRVVSLDLPQSGVSPRFEPLFTFIAGANEGFTRQLTSLEYVPTWRGFLLITATEDDENVFHGNTLWFVGDQSIEAAVGGVVEPIEIATFEVAMKAEGLAVLPGSDDEHVLEAVIVYDNDPKKTSIPSRYQTIRLNRP